MNRIALSRLRGGEGTPRRRRGLPKGGVAPGAGQMLGRVSGGAALQTTSICR
jgi:hypothetical protein